MPVCAAVGVGLYRTWPPQKPAARPPIKPAGKPSGEAPIGLPRSSVGLMLLVILIEYLTFI